MNWDIEKLDLDAYLARVGYDGPREPSMVTLRDVHRAHVTAIPFENVDVVLGRGVRVDLESLQDKLVTGGRGGYCHEHNLLFAAALERLGFRVRRHLARIRLGRGHLPRTHATLTVEADGEWWLADVGFGGDGLVEPVPFRDGASARLGEWAWRLGRDGGFWVLHARGGGPSGEVELYAFREDEPQYPADFEAANFYVAEFARSPFRHHLIVQRTTPDARIRIEDLIGDPRAAGARELAAALRDGFGLRLTERDDEELVARLMG